MLYLDEEVRKKFHQTNHTMQVILSIFEHYLAKWHLQLEVIDVIREHEVLVGVPRIPDDAALAACDYINELYPRKDLNVSCAICQPEYGTFVFHVTSSADLLQPL